MATLAGVPVYRHLGYGTVGVQDLPLAPARLDCEAGHALRIR